MPEFLTLRTPCCGSPILPIMEWVGLPGTMCENVETFKCATCDNEWDLDGFPTYSAAEFDSGDEDVYTENEGIFDN